MYGNSIMKVVESIESGTVHYGFYEKERWVSSGNYALNRLMSGSYYKAFCYGQTQLVGGISGSGKSLVLATAAKAAQDNGAYIVWIDTENATKRQWLERIGLKTTKDVFSFLEANIIDEVKKMISKFVGIYDAAKKKDDNAPPMFIVVDSYSMLLTSKQMTEANEGKSVGDQGQHAKQTKDLIKAVNALIGRRDILVAGIVHTMESQDKYSPDEVILGGRGAQYIAATVLVFSKYKLKAKDADSKTDAAKEDQIGIKCKATIRKSRYTRPDASIDMQVVFGQGIDKYSGLHDILMDEGVIHQSKKGWYEFSIAIPGVKQPGEAWRKKDIAGEMGDITVKYLEDNKDTLILTPVKRVKSEQDIMEPVEEDDNEE